MLKCERHVSRKENGVVEVTVIEYDDSTWTIGIGFGYIFTHTYIHTYTDAHIHGPKDRASTNTNRA